MAPAFSSAREAGAFALLLLLLLSLPLLVGKSGLPPREEVYASLPWRHGAYPYIQQQIFQEKGDIDIAFLGSSHIANGIFTPYVQQKLSERLGRQATVVSLCWAWQGLDALYFVAQDLLRHRKVRMIVFYDDLGANSPHRLAWHWVRFGDNAEALAGLPMRFKLAYYYGAILGMPRNLLNLLKPSLPVNLSPEKKLSLEQSPNGLSTEMLGAESVRLDYDEKRNDLFSPYTPRTDVRPADVSVYSPVTAAKFESSSNPIAPLQSYFASRFVALAQAHGTKLVCLNVPVFDDRKIEIIKEDTFWPLRSEVALVGISPAKLFAGLSDDDIRQLFAFSVHLNKNGQAYFTDLVTPALLQLYDQIKP